MLTRTCWTGWLQNPCLRAWCKPEAGLTEWTDYLHQWIYSVTPAACSTSASCCMIHLCVRSNWVQPLSKRDMHSLWSAKWVQCMRQKMKREKYQGQNKQMSSLRRELTKWLRRGPTATRGPPNKLGFRSLFKYLKIQFRIFEGPNMLSKYKSNKN